MSFAPRVAERLLEALCPPSEFRDGVVGDLSEEYLQRRYSDGPLAARIWYYGQALANAPHLLAHGAARATPGAWVRATVYGFCAMIIANVVVLGVQTAIVMSLGVVPDSIGIVYVAWRDVVENYPLMPQLIRGAPWLVSALAGHVIGRRHREAPLAAVGASAIGAGVIAVAFVAMSAEGRPVLFYVAFATNLAVWMFSMAAGGASAALAMEPSHRH